MLIPIGTDRPIRRPTKVVYWLIALNIAVHLVMVLVEGASPRAYETALETGWLSVEPEWLSRLEVGNEAAGVEDADGSSALGLPDYSFKWWSPVTYQFLHGGLLHLLGNMLFLFVFGPNIEDRLGRRMFTALYLVGGVFAGFAHLLLADTVPLLGIGGERFGAVPPVIGASGSISALTGAYLVLFPKTRVKVLLFFFIIGVFMLPAWVFIAFAIARDLLLQGYSEVAGVSAGVAYLAHIGGYVFGAGVSLLLLWRGWMKREPYDLFSIGRQAHRRRQFRELTTGGKGAVWESQLADDAGVRRRERGRVRGGGGGEKPDGLAVAREEVAGLVGRGDVEGAAERYRRLLEEFGEQAVARDAQLAVANELSRQELHADAATAYRVFEERFRQDPELDRVLLVLGMINLRQLNDPVAAGEYLGRVRADRVSDGERAVLDALRRELG